MPLRKTPFYNNSNYHIYNCGIDNRDIFTDHKDFSTFLDIVHYYLQKTEEKQEGALKRTGPSKSGSFQGRVNLLAFCLLPTNFHLLLHQTDEEALSNFLRRVSTTYVIHFNKRHRRSGPLFQGRFKARHMDTFDYLLESSKYIHLRPNDLPGKPSLTEYQWSSYPTYTNDQRPHSAHYLVDKKYIIDHLNFTRPGTSYQTYTESIPFPDWFNQTLDWIQ